MTKNELKDRGYDIIGQIAKAMGHAHRLELLELLGNGPKSVIKLAREARMSVANTSQHLQKLKQAGLVKTRRSFNTIYYRLADPVILPAIRGLHQIAASQRPDMTALLQSFRKNYGTDTAVVYSLPDEEHILLDVRPPEEYAWSHHRRAMNIPYYRLDKEMHRLDKNKLIVAYCRGELCTYADEVVARLLAAGYRAVRLAEPVMMKSA